MNIKRQRGRGRNKPANNNPNRAYESTGPDMKVRGSAQTILEKYQQAGRDAMASGDRVLAENYMQHAEHYLRLLKSIQPHFVPRSELAIAGLPPESDEEGANIENNDIDAEISENSDASDDENEVRETRNNWRDNRNGRNDRYNNNRRRNPRDRYNNRNRDNQQEGDDNRVNNDEASYATNGAAKEATGEFISDDNATDTRAVSQPENSQYEGNNENANIAENSEIATQAEGDNQENTAQSEKPTRTRRTGSRLRSPLGRRPRTKRAEPTENKEEPTGFGEELPAFLAQAPTPSSADV